MVNLWELSIYIFCICDIIDLSKRKEHHKGVKANVMEITTKDNGFNVSNELKNVISRFEEVAIERFGEDNIDRIEHFYYGDKMSMTDIVLVNDRNYAHFNIYSKGVYFSGHTCTHEEYKIFTSLCWNDECFPQGTLF